MQFKNIIATIAAFAVAGTVAGPLPNEGFEIVERATNQVNANLLHNLAQNAITKKGPTVGEKPTEEQLKELFTQVGKREAGEEDLEKRWYNPYWQQYNWNYNGYNTLYYCGAYGYYCYYPYTYSGYTNWYGLYNGYYWPVNWNTGYANWYGYGYYY